MKSLLTATHLRCEYLVNPLGIDVRTPRLSWEVEATYKEQRSLQQTAYQIVVSSTPEALLLDDGDLWSTGKVLSSQSAHIVYDGSTLNSQQICWWKVRVWDNHDQLSEYSNLASWEMGLLHDEDWLGQWISAEEIVRLQDDYDEQDQQVLQEKAGLFASPYFRKIINLTQPVQKARLYITAKGLYEARINGQNVSTATFAPGWTDYNHRIQYQTYDVTTQLQAGENALGVILGSGWYCGYVGFKDDHSYHHYGTEPAFLYQLQIDYSDGSNETFISNASWLSTTGPIIYSDFLAGEIYDARRELAGWDQPGYADEQWAGVQSLPGDNIPLIAEHNEPVRVTEILRPRHINEVRPGTFIFDLGQNMVGWVRLRVTGRAGTRVQLRFAEILNPDGTIYTTNLRSARATDTYILKGEGEEIFEPHFTFHGFRYVEVTGYPGQPELDSITGCVIHSDTPATGSFTCSSPLVNQLQHNIIWGQRGNFLSVPTDCPQRDERLGWMGDAQIFVRTASYNMDVAAFFSKWMDDVEDAQTEDGGFSDVAPRLIVQTNGAPAWGDAGIIVPWTIYQMYGDTQIIERHYDAMVHWLNYLDKANPDHLWRNNLNNNYGDWLSIAADTPKDVLATAYFAYDAQLLAQMARAIGREEDALRFEQLYRDICSAFCQAFVDQDGRIQGATQTVYVVALQMNLLPSDLRPVAARHLVEAIEAKNWHLSTGFVGVGYLCPVLTEAGYPDIAYRLLNNDTFPSWGYSIRHGATTIWERWDGWTEEKGFQDPGMNSFNHYSLGSIGQWLYQYVAGIDVDRKQPGFQDIRIQPYPGGGLTEVKATYHSLHGLISSAWTQDEGRFTLQVSIPANTRATISLPASNPEAILESGKAAREAEGVNFVGIEGSRIIFEVGSGDYQFIVQ